MSSLPNFNVEHGICINIFRPTLELFDYCFYSKVWRYLDVEIASTPMPQEYRNYVVSILCRDCHKVTCATWFNFIHKVDFYWLSFSFLRFQCILWEPSALLVDTITLVEQVARSTGPVSWYLFALDCIPVDQIHMCHILPFSFRFWWNYQLGMIALVAAHSSQAKGRPSLLFEWKFLLRRVSQLTRVDGEAVMMTCPNAQRWKVKPENFKPET